MLIILSQIFAGKVKMRERLLQLEEAAPVYYFTFIFILILEYEIWLLQFLFRQKITGFPVHLPGTYRLCKMLCKQIKLAFQDAFTSTVSILIVTQIAFVLLRDIRVICCYLSHEHIDAIYLFLPLLDLARQ